jgi:hypothetical protein
MQKAAAAEEKRQRPSIQAVEGAVWAALSASWLALRLSLGPARLDAWIVAPTACFAVVTLAMSAALPQYTRQVEEKFFQCAFGAWLASLCLALDASTSRGAQEAFLNDPWLSVASVALSTAFATVQMLAAAGAAGDRMFAGQQDLWLDVYFLLVTAAQACAFRNSQQGATGVVIALNVFSVWGLGARMWKLPDQVNIGLVSLQTFLEIARYSLHVVTLLTALAAAYLANTTTFALAAVSVPGLFAGALQLAESITKKPVLPQEPPSENHEPSAPTEAEIRRAEQAQGQTAARFTQGDALLFARTRTLTTRLKRA